jgi:acid phosphatase type 7
MLRAAKHQIPCGVYPRAQRRARDDMVGASFVSLVRALAPLILALGSVAGGPAILPAPSSVADNESAPILIGAGDINDCGHPEGARSTAEILEGYPTATIFAAGDLAYFSGSDAAFRCYDKTWGRPSLRERTRPAVGNHEYVTYGAAGFFKYWRKARQNKPWQTTGGDLEKAYYSYNLGAWHIVVINSECADSAFFRDGAPSCGQGSQQERWLREDLRRFPTACTLAYWHHPLFNNGGRHGGSPKMKPIWQALYDFNADVVLTGHEHDYERFAPQNPDGQLDPRRGIREFVVGTGGKMEKGQFVSDHNSEHQEKGVIGVLKLTLHPKSYEFEYIRGNDKKVLDSGSGDCHGR